MPFSGKGFPLGELRMSMAGLTDGAIASIGWMQSFTYIMYVRDQCCKHKRLLCTCWVMLDDRTHRQGITYDQGTCHALGGLAGCLGDGWLAEAQKGQRGPERPREADRG